MSHTPGPWNVCEQWPFQPDGMRLDWERLQNLWIVGVRPGTAVAAVDAGHEGTAEANARLIAAAPDLLEACMMALADYEAAYLVLYHDRGDTAQRRADLDARITVLRAAIDKAGFV